MFCYCNYKQSAGGGVCCCYSFAFVLERFLVPFLVGVFLSFFFLK